MHALDCQGFSLSFGTWDKLPSGNDTKNIGVVDFQKIVESRRSRLFALIHINSIADFQSNL
jgi:hypothetical protein